MKKQDVLNLLEQLPEEIPAEQLIHELYLMAETELASTHRAPGYLPDEEELVEMGEDWYE